MIRKLLYILFRKYPNLNIDKFLFRCFVSIPITLFGISFLIAQEFFLILIGGFGICYLTNITLLNIRYKMARIQHIVEHEREEEAEKRKQEQRRQKPNLYIVRKSK